MVHVLNLDALVIDPSFIVFCCLYFIEAWWYPGTVNKLISTDMIHLKLYLLYMATDMHQ